MLAIFATSIYSSGHLQPGEDAVEPFALLLAPIAANIGYTAFGPTNVTIHRMSAAVALDDPYQLLATSE